MDDNYFQYNGSNIITNFTINPNPNENFITLKKLEKKLEKKIDNVEYCSNPIYKSVVFVILVGILLYFIWFISRKKYYEDDDIYNIRSTPFYT